MSVLRLACVDTEAPPLFGRIDVTGRHGYEPAVAALVAGRLGRDVEWYPMPWVELLPAVRDGRADAVLCGQTIIPARQEQVDFTRPYAVFHESVLVRAGSGVTGPGDLAGLRVAAIAGSTNMALAETFPGIVPVPFGGATDDVFTEMLDAVRSGEADALVDDDVVMVPLAGDPAFEVAFTVRTGNRWGIGVAKTRPGLLAEIDGALADAVADGSLEKAWLDWLPGLDYPFGSA